MNELINKKSTNQQLTMTMEDTRIPIAGLSSGGGLSISLRLRLSRPTSRICLISGLEDSGMSGVSSRNVSVSEKNMLTRMSDCASPGPEGSI